MNKIIKSHLSNKRMAYKKIVGDTLVAYVQDSLLGFTSKMTFNTKDTILNKSICDFHQITFDCSPCSQVHLKDYKKLCHFRQVSENKYLSTYFWQTEMYVTYKSPNKNCLVITFVYVDKPKKEYKSFYKSLDNKK